MNPQAEALNEIVKKSSPTVYDLLSEKGKGIFFPKKGILAQTAAAKGKKINATIGAAIEDDGTPMRLKSLADKVDLSPDRVFPYAPSYGRPDMRKKWQEMLVEKNPNLKGKAISLPVASLALTHGLSIMGYLFADSGEKIILSDLYWGNYNLIFKNGYGVDFDTFSLFDGGKFGLASFREKLLEGAARTRKVILNFPNNPTGYSPTVEEARDIVAAIKESAEAGNKVLVVMDDAYYGLVYEEGIEGESLFSWLADLHENVLAVKVDGPTKEDYVWGLRVGFITFGIRGGTPELYDALEQKTAGAIRGNISNAPNVSQSLLLDTYTSSTYEAEKKEKYRIMKDRYDAVKKVLAENESYRNYFTAMPFNSGYFMCVKLADGIDGEKVRAILLDEFDTGIINLNNVIRVAFSAVSAALIPELFENLYKACQKAAS